MGSRRRFLSVALTALVLVAACAKDEGAVVGEPAEMKAVSASGLPPGTWPLVACGSGTVATTLLDQIQQAADDARAAGAIDDETWALITTRVQRCRSNFPPFVGGNALHCGFVRNARDAAWLGDWALCLKELEHGH